MIIESTVMSPKFRPILAAKIRSTSELKQYPYIASPKIDGIRCITRAKTQSDMFYEAKVEGVSRTLTPIPNYHIQRAIGLANLMGLDSEIVTFTNGVMDKYNTVQSKVMSEHGEPDFKLMVFDLVMEGSYVERLLVLYHQIIFPVGVPYVKLESVLIENEAQLNAYEIRCLEKGYEGVMLRSQEGKYKFGRATFKEQYLIKMKRFEDSEATITGFVELLHNTNPIADSTITGLTERSDHKANMVPGETLGALVVQMDNNGILLRFQIGTGFDQRTRQEIWDNRHSYIGKVVKFKHQPHGAKEAPRCPVFIGFRNSNDL